MSNPRPVLRYGQQDSRQQRTPMSPLERKAAFKAAVTLHEMTMAEASAQFGISYNHLTLVLAGKRKGSLRLEEAIAAFLKRKRTDVF